MEDQLLDLQEEIIEQQNDEESRQIFYSSQCQTMWLKCEISTPWGKAKLLCISFSSSYIFELVLVQ